MRHPPGEAVAALAQETPATHELATSIRPVARGVNHTGSEKRLRITLGFVVSAFVGLAGCTAMDVISILKKKGQKISPYS